MKNWINIFRGKTSKKKLESALKKVEEPVTEKSTSTEIKIKEPVTEKQEPTLRKAEEPVTEKSTSTEIKTKELVVGTKKPGWLSKLGENFKRTSSNIKKAIFSKKISEYDLDYLQDALIMSDLGVTFSEQLINDLKKKKIQEGKLKDEVTFFLQSQFKESNHKFEFKKKVYPQIVLFFGVNGSGKTTTLAKLAYKAKLKGLNLKIIAADTFRAAAVEQLIEWGAKHDLDIFKGFHNEDPSSVVYKGHKEAIKDKTDVLLIDTAGRLHNKTELMEELKKIVRTIQKNDPSAPHNKVLVLDSTIGQNTYSQLEAFDSSVGITGVIMTKLDSSSKGGSLIGISKKYNTPIHFIGVGEKVDDLIDFNAKDFINALIGESFGEKDESIY